MIALVILLLLKTLCSSVVIEGWKSYNRKVIGRFILVGVLTGTKRVELKHFHTLINMFKKTLPLPIPANEKNLTDIYLIEYGTGQVKRIKGCHEIDI